MTTRLRLAIVVAGVCALALPSVGLSSLAAAGQESVAQTQAFRSQSSGVFVDVSVRQGQRPVTGLTAADFTLLDNGVLQQITEVSYERLPIDVTVALDVSGSVSGALLDRLRQSIDLLRMRLRDGDRLKLMTFNARVHRVVDFTDRGVDTRQLFAGITGAGGTALFDALAVALTSAAEGERRQLVIVFSDGQDTSSIIYPGLLLDLVRRSTPTVTFVRPAAVDRVYQSSLTRPDGSSSLGTRSLTPGDMWNLHREIAAETGGVALDTASANLSGSFGRILDDFRASYVLRYTAKGVGEAGFHALTVQVRRPGTFDLRARRGYFAD